VASPTIEPAKPKRLPDAAVTRADISAMDRELLSQAEAAAAQGRTAEAVEKFVGAARNYLSRSQPAKASQVLRQAVRLQPDAVEVHILLAETLAQMRLPEDAAAAYTKAAGLLQKVGQSAPWLDIIRKMVALDPDDLHGRVRVAEFLSRAGRRTEAADILRALAGDLLSRGEIDDWEKVAERLAHHAPDDTTTAHDLALHYVRTERHALALPKLVACYEAEHRDAELLELVVDTLEALGQRERAAAICRQLLKTYRSTGLRAEAEKALERLYDLDPDDAEARAYLGVLQPAVQGGTVIDFEVGQLPARRATSGGFAAAGRQPESGGFDLPEAPAGGFRRTLRGVEQAAPVAPTPVAAPRSTQPAPPPSVRQSDDDDFDGSTVTMAQPAPLQRAIAPPVPAAARAPSQAQPQVRQIPPAAIAARAPSQAQPIVPISPRPAQPPAARAPSQGLQAVVPVAQAPAAVARTVAPSEAITARPAAPQPGVGGPRTPANPPAAPAPRQVAPPARTEAAAAPWGVPATASATGRVAAVPSLDALASTLGHDDDDEGDAWPADDEAGFEVEDRTLVEAAVPDEHPIPAVGRAPAPLLQMGPGAPPPMPASPSAQASSAPHPAQAPSGGQPVLSARQRSNSLPRPRLARRAGTVSELPTAVRDMTKDINTLEFFIERGFQDSAVALLDELCKRHPDSAQLRAYRTRIERMQRT